MSLVQTSKSNEKWLKNSNNQIVLEKRVYTYLAV